MLVAERRERMLDPLPLVEERVAEVLGVDALTASPFCLGRPPVAEARRRSISAGPIPVSSTIFSRPPWPETSVRAVRGSASVSARRRRTASFARPRSGASVTRTFQASPCRPTTAVRPAPGLTRRRSRVVSAVTRSVYVGPPQAAFASGHAVPAALLARRPLPSSTAASGSCAAAGSGSSNAESASSNCSRSRRESCSSRSFSAIARRWISRASACASLRISSASRRAWSRVWAEACSAETSVVRRRVSSSRKRTRSASSCSTLSARSARSRQTSSKLAAISSSSCRSARRCSRGRSCAAV